MKTLFKTLILSLALSAGSAFAQYSPVTTHGAGFDVNLYETLDGSPTGERSTVGPLIDLPYYVAPGYLILLGSGDPTDPASYENRANWTDVAWIDGNTIQLFSQQDGIIDSLPTLDKVMAESHVFALESITSPTIYSAAWTVEGVRNENNYFFHTDAVAVPEPSQLAYVAILCVGGVGYYAKRRKTS